MIWSVLCIGIVRLAPNGILLLRVTDGLFWPSAPLLLHVVTFIRLFGRCLSNCGPLTTTCNMCGMCEEEKQTCSLFISLDFRRFRCEVKSSADSASNGIEKTTKRQQRKSRKAIRVAHVRRKCGRWQCGTQEVYFVSLRSISNHAPPARAKSGWGWRGKRSCKKKSSTRCLNFTAFDWS